MNNIGGREGQNTASKPSGDDIDVAASTGWLFSSLLRLQLPFKGVVRGWEASQPPC